jgi:hypothetical protein
VREFSLSLSLSLFFFVAYLVSYLLQDPWAPISDTDEVALIKDKMKFGTVISVYGDGQRKSRLVKLLCHQLRLSKSGNDDVLDIGAKFDKLLWVPVVGGQQEALNLLDFSRRMLVVCGGHFGFYDGDMHELWGILGGSTSFGTLLDLTEEDAVGYARESLLNVKNNLLVIIDGLRSKKDWDIINSNFVLPEIPRTCCFLVVTDDLDVARHCVGGNEEQLVCIKDGGGPVRDLFFFFFFCFSYIIIIIIIIIINYIDRTH